MPETHTEKYLAQTAKYDQYIDFIPQLELQNEQLANTNMTTNPYFQQHQTGGQPGFRPRNASDRQPRPSGMSIHSKMETKRKLKAGRRGSMNDENEDRECNIFWRSNEVLRSFKS